MGACRYSASNVPYEGDEDAGKSGRVLKQDRECGWILAAHYGIENANFPSLAVKLSAATNHDAPSNRNDSPSTM
jgi:hypothetical protein